MKFKNHIIISVDEKMSLVKFNFPGDSEVKNLPAIWET